MYNLKITITMELKNLSFDEFNKRLAIAQLGEVFTLDQFKKIYPIDLSPIHFTGCKFPKMDRSDIALHEGEMDFVC